MRRSNILIKPLLKSLLIKEKVPLIIIKTSNFAGRNWTEIFIEIFPLENKIS